MNKQFWKRSRFWIYNNNQHSSYLINKIIDHTKLTKKYNIAKKYLLLHDEFATNNQSFSLLCLGSKIFSFRYHFTTLSFSLEPLSQLFPLLLLGLIIKDTTFDFYLLSLEGASTGNFRLALLAYLLARLFNEASDFILDFFKVELARVNLLLISYNLAYDLTRFCLFFLKAR